MSGGLGGHVGTCVCMFCVVRLALEQDISKVMRILHGPQAGEVHSTVMKNLANPAHPVKQIAMTAALSVCGF